MDKLLRRNDADGTFVPIGDVDAFLGEIRRNDTPEHFVLSRSQMEEMLDDAQLFAVAMERLKNDSGKTYTFEEILAKDGLTLSDLEDMEDVELE
jgi:hypothetical protein